MVALALLIGVGINNVIWALADWHLTDMDAYYQAALRIRAGEPLYGGDVTPLNAYRYAPWFAYAWVPLSQVPDTIMRGIWSLILVLGSAAALWPFMRERTNAAWVLVFLMGPILLGISSIGNVQGPMVALLVLGMPTRWAGAAIGVAASLKVVPILLVLALIAERRWLQAAVAMLVAGILWSPIVAFEISPVTLDPGVARTLPTPLSHVVVIIAVTAAGALAWRGSKWTHIVAATAALLVLPRLFVYEVTLLMAGASWLGATRESVPPRQLLFRRRSSN